MREEVVRIMRLVEQGKIKPEDAAELIEALEFHAEQERPVSEGAAANTGEETEQAEGSAEKPDGSESRDAFSEFFDTIEKATKATVEKIDLKGITEQVKAQAKRGVEELQKAMEQVSKGEFWARVNIKTGHAEEKHQELTFSIDAGKKLRIENPIGDIVVTGGADMAQVVADAVIRASTREKAEEKAHSWAVMVEEVPEGSIVRIPKLDESFSATCDLNVRVPNGVALEIRSTNGDVSISQTNGSVDVDTMKGDVSVQNAQGSVRLYLTTGDLHLQDAEGDRVHMETRSGDIHAVRVRGNITATATSGDMEFDDLAGARVNLETVNGDVQVAMAEPALEQLAIRSVNGDVNLQIPDGGSYKVNLTAVSGDVSCDLPASQVERGDRHWRGVVGDGGGVLEVNTVRGDINVDLRDTQTTST